MKYGRLFLRHIRYDCAFTKIIRIDSYSIYLIIYSLFLLNLQQLLYLFNFLPGNSGATISDDKNVVSSLTNIDPQIGLGVNPLNQVTQTISGATGGGGGLLGGVSNVGGVDNNISGKQVSK